MYFNHLLQLNSYIISILFYAYMEEIEKYLAFNDTLRYFLIKYLIIILNFLIIMIINFSIIVNFIYFKYP